MPPRPRQQQCACCCGWLLFYGDKENQLLIFFTESCTVAGLATGRSQSMSGAKQGLLRVAVDATTRTAAVEAVHTAHVVLMTTRAQHGSCTAPTDTVAGKSSMGRGGMEWGGARSSTSTSTPLHLQAPTTSTSTPLQEEDGAVHDRECMHKRTRHLQAHTHRCRNAEGQAHALAIKPTCHRRQRRRGDIRGSARCKYETSAP